MIVTKTKLLAASLFVLPMFMLPTSADAWKPTRNVLKPALF